MNEGYAQDMDNEQGGGIIPYLPAILWQRRWWIIAPTVAGTVIGIAAASLMPASYQSSATLLVESPQIPANVGGQMASSSTNLIDRRIASVRQQILSRPDLIELVEGNNLYPEERRRGKLSEVLDTMRGATSITPVSADIGGSGSNTIAFSLSFRYPEAVKAQIVAQDFVERLVKLDASQTAEQATGTVEFLQQRANDLAGQVSAIERQVESIKLANGMALSTGSSMMIQSGGGGYETQIAQLQRENAQLTAQLRQQSGAVDRDPVVAAAETQLASARAIYSDNHPDVRAAEQRLAEAKRLGAQNVSRADVGGAIRNQIAANNASIANLRSAMGTEQSRTAALAQAQARAPAVLEQISQLQARADGLRSNYQAAQTDLMNARGSAQISEQRRGERLTVIDPPVVPDKPTSPNRPVLVLGGLIAGAGLGVVIAFLLELIARPIRGVGALQNVIGEPPLVIVPKLLRKKSWRDRLPRFRKRAPAAATPA
ncbi:Wzz/FepE/Etk N-terminal domain-containing protein [Sphingomonas cynarae]|uniref:Wzz/FepE/Etk N-terminal domain-containing protein n=1 Tax=Sphingomonas cynarae TaxID=930197 RepID=A0ABP7DNH4_9SPHN